MEKIVAGLHGVPVVIGKMEARLRPQTTPFSLGAAADDKCEDTDIIYGNQSLDIESTHIGGNPDSEDF
jgi:hypothetical protein